MRKKAFLILAVVMIVAITSVALIACGEETTTTANPVHKISAVAGENYEIKNLASSAQVGDPVYFDVEVTSRFYTLESVLANDVVCVDTGFGHKFTMPDEDVVITVNLAPVGEYNDPDDKLDWGSTLVDTIPSGITGTFDLPLSFPGINSGNWITSIETTIESSDQTVIPSDAIEFVPTKASTSSALIGGKLSVDLSKVSPGKTFIYVYLDPNNSRLGTLIKEFTVSENSQIEIEMMDVTFTYDNMTDYDVQNIFLNITDTNYVQGSDYEEIQTIYLRDFIDGTYTFSYAVGHTYRLSTAYSVLGDDGYYDTTTLYLNEWVGTNVGAENYIDRHETINGLYILKATTQGIEIPLVISDTK